MRTKKGTKAVNRADNNTQLTYDMENWNHFSVLLVFSVFSKYTFESVFSFSFLTCFVKFLSPLKKATGTYEILYSSGKNYVGKGGFDRAIKSAVDHAKPNMMNNMLGDTVVSIKWKASKNHVSAFIEEYALQTIRGVNNPTTYNKIWSPGKKLFQK